MSAARKLVSPAFHCKAVEDLLVFYEALKEVTTTVNGIEGKKKTEKDRVAVFMADARLLCG